MKQIYLTLAVLAILIHAPGCSPAIEKQSPAVRNDVGAAKADRLSTQDVKAPQTKVDPDVPIAFAGKFDPYAAFDKNIKDRIVMVQRPDCGSCHMKATLTGRRLNLVVDRGNRTKDWTLQGQPDGETMVFEKPKIRIVLSGNKLSGKFKGKMHANIELAATPGDQDGGQ